MSSDPIPRRVVPIQGGPRQVPPGRQAPDRRATGGPPVHRPAVEPPPADRSAGDERFRALFEHAPVGVALSELDGSFSEVNAALRALLAGSGIDPDRGGLADLAGRLSQGSEEARAWARDLADVHAGRLAAARVELPLTAAGAQQRWVAATVALMVLGERRYLLTHLEDTTGRRLAEQRLLRLALHDGLTGLANRALLADRLDAALARSGRTGLPVGVLCADLDEFRRVNDALGHQGGDAVLVAIAHQLSRVVRAGDTVGRAGGDEFVVIAADLADDAALIELTRRIDAALREPLDVDRARLRVAASVGAALARPGDTLATVLRRADAAMFEVKRTRRPVASIDLQESLAVLPQDSAPADRPL